MHVDMTTSKFRSLRFLRGLFVFTFAAVVATPASAQLGKLKKIAADAAKDAAQGKKPETPTTTVANGGARVDYTITDERLKSIVAVLEPRAADARAEMEYRDAVKAHEAKTKAITECVQKSSMGGTPDMAAATSQKTIDLSNKIATYGEKVQKAYEAKQYRAYIAYQDSALVSQIQMSASIMGAGKCGTMPFKPIALVEREAAEAERTMSGRASESSGEELVVQAQYRVGMTPGQFGRIRERLAIWLLIQSGDLPPTAEKFTEEEDALMKKMAAELKMLAPLFKSGTMRWATWGDVKSW